MHKHKRVWLPTKDPAMEANLDELSLQGWEFVAWCSDEMEIFDIVTSIPVGYQRQALLRQDQG
jgi:hypothetical protein